jgi:PPOX class probable FMN-dependent enzyme
VTRPTRYFEDQITTRDELRRHLKQPSRRVSHKVIDHVDDICARFIAAAPFAVVATRGADGRLDVSPKGDPAGFVAVLDSHTLAIPDRPGNNRADGFENLLVHPEVGLLFLIPGVGDTLRVSGTGRIVRDAALRERLAVQDRAPNLVLVVDVAEAFLHCPKCIVRSHLWQPDHWPDTTDVPSLGQAMVAHGRLSETVDEMQAIIEKDRATRLY